MIVGRVLSADVPPMAMTFLRWLFALLILAPFASPHLRREGRVVRRNWRPMLFIAEYAFGRHMVVTPGNVAAIVTVALFWSVLAYVFWNQGVAQVGPNIAGLFVHLMPVFGILLAWIFLDERLARFHIAGIALILSGIGITSRVGRRSAPLPAGIDGPEGGRAMRLAIE